MAKPAFDPSKPFKKVEAAKPAFDPSRPFRALAPPSEGAASDAPSAKVDWLTALGRGLGQGATASFGDEAAGLVQALGERYLPESMGGGGAQAQRASFANLYRGNRDAARQEDVAAQREDPYYLNTLGNIVGGVPLAIATAGKGKTLGAALKAGALFGGASGLGGSKADLTRGELGEFGRAGLDTALSALLGMSGAGLGFGLEKLVGAGARSLSGKATQKAAQATEKIAQLAKESVDKVTREARSAAGTAATAAYKNATNIEEAIKAGAMAFEDLTPEQLSLYRGLLRERAGKGAAELVKDTATKTAKAGEYADVLASVPGRLTEANARIGNPMNQLMPRLKRYGPVALGAIAGHYLFPGYGAGAGGFVGAALRPTIRALLRMTQHPSVQRPMWNTLGGLARGVGYGSGIAAPALGGSSGRALTPELAEALLPMLLGGGEPRPENMDWIRGRGSSARPPPP